MVQTLRGHLAVSYKKKHAFTTQSSNHTPWHLPEGVENICSNKNLHTHVIVALFITAKTWKQTRCPSVGEWINCGTSRQ